MCKLLFESLSNKDSSLPLNELTTIYQLTEAIESALADKFIPNNKIEQEAIKQYTKKAMSIIFNLKSSNNKDLRDDVFNLTISPEELVSMEAKDMASSELKKKRDQIKSESFDSFKTN